MDKEIENRRLGALCGLNPYSPVFNDLGFVDVKKSIDKATQLQRAKDLKEEIDIIREINHINQTTSANFLRSVTQERLDEFRNKLLEELKRLET